MANGSNFKLLFTEEQEQSKYAQSKHIEGLWC